MNRNFILEDDQEFIDAQKDMQTPETEDVQAFLKNFEYDTALEMWVMLDFSDYTGTSIERSNARYLLAKYPSIITEDKGAKFNATTVGIHQEDITNISTEELILLRLDVKTMDNQGILDDHLYKEVQKEKRSEAWNEWLGSNFLTSLNLKFRDIELAEEFTRLRDSSLMRGLFEEARELSGEEWIEHKGAEQTVNMDSVVNVVTREMVSQWINRQNESLKRKKAFLSLELTCGSSIVHANEWDGSTTFHPRHELVRDIAKEHGLLCELSGTIDGNEQFSDAYLRLGPDDLPKAVQILKEAGWEGDILDIYNSGTLNLDDIHQIATFARNQGWQLGKGFENLEENLMEARDFSYVKAPAPPDLADTVLRWGQMFITDDVLYPDSKGSNGFGREDDIHITVKFGLHESEPSKELLRIIEETQPFEIDIGPCTLFDTNEQYDVVKFDVDGNGLRTLNSRISKLPNSDSYPDYQPHCTVAYVVKGSCNELIGKPLMDTDHEEALKFLVKRVIFSDKDKVAHTLFLGKPNLKLEPAYESVKNCVL